MILARRGFLRCLTGLIAAPAVVKADALMKIVGVPPIRLEWQESWRMLNLGIPLDKAKADWIARAIRPPLLLPPAEHRAERAIAAGKLRLG